MFVFFALPPPGRPPAKEENLKIPVTWSDGTGRHNYLGTWSLDPVKLRNWVNNSDPSETLWETSPGQFYLLRVPDREFTEREREGTDWVMDATAHKMSPVDALRWFEKRPFVAPPDIVALANSELGRTSIWSAADSIAQRQSDKRSVDVVQLEVIRLVRDCGSFVSSKPAGAISSIGSGPEPQESQDAFAERSGGIKQVEGEDPRAFHARFAKANLELALMWIERTWIPARDALRACNLAALVASLAPTDQVHAMTHALFGRFLMHEFAESKETARLLAELLTRLQGERPRVSTYFDWLASEVQRLTRIDATSPPVNNPPIAQAHTPLAASNESGEYWPSDDDARFLDLVHCHVRENPKVYLEAACEIDHGEYGLEKLKQDRAKYVAMRKDDVDQRPAPLARLDVDWCERELAGELSCTLSRLNVVVGELLHDWRGPVGTGGKWTQPRRTLTNAQCRIIMLMTSALFDTECHAGHPLIDFQKQPWNDESSAPSHGRRRTHVILCTEGATRDWIAMARRAAEKLRIEHPSRSTGSTTLNSDKGSGTRSTSDAGPKLTKVEQAIVALANAPCRVVVDDLAKQVGCAKQTLYGSSKFKHAWQSYKVSSALRYGTKFEGIADAEHSDDLTDLD